MYPNIRYDIFGRKILKSKYEHGSVVGRQSDLNSTRPKEQGLVYSPVSKYLYLQIQARIPKQMENDTFASKKSLLYHLVMIPEEKNTIPIVRFMLCHEPRPRASGAFLAASLFCSFVFLFLCSHLLVICSCPLVPCTRHDSLLCTFIWDKI